MGRRANAEHFRIHDSMGYSGEASLRIADYCVWPRRLDVFAERAQPIAVPWRELELPSRCLADEGTKHKQRQLRGSLPGPSKGEHLADPRAIGAVQCYPSRSLRCRRG